VKRWQEEDSIHKKPCSNFSSRHCSPELPTSKKKQKPIARQRMEGTPAKERARGPNIGRRKNGGAALKGTHFAGWQGKEQVAGKKGEKKENATWLVQDKLFSRPRKAGQRLTSSGCRCRLKGQEAGRDETAIGDMGEIWQRRGLMAAARPKERHPRKIGWWHLGQRNRFFGQGRRGTMFAHSEGANMSLLTPPITGEKGLLRNTRKKARDSTTSGKLRRGISRKVTMHTVISPRP